MDQVVEDDNNIIENYDIENTLVLLVDLGVDASTDDEVYDPPLRERATNQDICMVQNQIDRVRGDSGTTKVVVLIKERMIRKDYKGR